MYHPPLVVIIQARLPVALVIIQARLPVALFFLPKPHAIAPVPVVFWDRIHHVFTLAPGIVNVDHKMLKKRIFTLNN